MNASKSHLLREKLDKDPASVSMADLAHAVTQGTSMVKTVLGTIVSIVVAAILGGWWLFDMRDDLDDHSDLPAHEETAKVLHDVSVRLQSAEHSQKATATTQAEIATTQKETVKELGKIRRDVDRNTERLRTRRR